MLSEIVLQFEAGTLLLSEAAATLLGELPGCLADPRTGEVRAEARYYRSIVEHLRAEGIPYRDEARQYQVTPWNLQTTRTPFPHQSEALTAWWKAGGRGVVVLPTGTGKTMVALLAIAHANRPTIVVTPTLDLMNQWYAELKASFGGTIGLIGGGAYDMQPLMVTTYDSAYIYLERWGNRFGLVVFDECHHLPGPSIQYAAIGSIAPYRLGLTATPERADGRQEMMPDLVGPIVYRREIRELAGDFLAEYRVERCEVELSPEETERYKEARNIYRLFVEQNGISFGAPDGWRRFLQLTCRSVEGRAAFRAYREQRRISLAAPAKIHLLADLIQKHANDRVLIFTYDNATVYLIARQFLIPAITHQTKTRERQQILERFHSGEYTMVVTSHVLNEGVDIPAANVGIVLSGTGSVREHVQRLGRLLRKHADKQAILYEVISKGTGEEYTSRRRRQHHAYD